MRIVKQITNNKFLNIKEVQDADTHTKGYQFAERRGVDSIAFIGYDAEKNRFLLVKEFTPPLGVFMTRAFGGSIDKDKSREEIVRDEVKEEAGYEVPLSQIHEVGRCFVSTQMNQFCYLYVVGLSDKYKTERAPENAMEAMAEPVWMDLAEIVKNEDWKAIAIAAKAGHLEYGDV